MRITFQRQGTLLIAKIFGELDQHHAAATRELMDVALRERTVTRFIFDCSHLDFMDSAGIGILLGRYKTAQALSCTMAIVTDRESVRRVLELSDIPRLIPVCRTLTAAKAALSEGCRHA